MTQSICTRVIREAVPAEPYAVSVDLLNASGELEQAIYAQSAGGASMHLSNAAQWVRWAQQRAGRVGDETLALRAACVASELEGWAQSVPAGDLATWQEQTLVPYQGVLGGLGLTEATENSRSATLAFLGVVGMGVVTFMGFTSQSRGGRGRSTPARR